MRVIHTLALGIILGGVVMSTTATAATDTLVKVETRSGVQQPFVVIEPKTTPVASVILFTGGNGKIRTHRDGTDIRNKNFLVRTRHLFAGHGLLVAVADVPSDRRRGGLIRFRTTLDHARDIKGVMDWLRNKADVPVFLIGTSRGTISAAGVPARLNSEGVGGVVLTSTVTRYNNAANKDKVFDADLSRIRTPVLVVWHEDDGCYVTPASDAGRLMSALVNAPVKKLLTYKGGKDAISNECGAQSEHGFFGIEDLVVADIAAWIKAQAIKQSSRSRR